MVEPIEDIFPGLRNSPFAVTSPATRAYNCIAWAAGDTTRWWWPDVDADNDAIFWPAGIAMDETLDAFAAAFATIGFTPCSAETVEPGFERVAPVRIRRNSDPRRSTTAKRPLDEQAGISPRY
jgi:hypothetical protein